MRAADDTLALTLYNVWGLVGHMLPCPKRIRAFADVEPSPTPVWQQQRPGWRTFKARARLRCERSFSGTGFAMTDAGDELLTPARPVYVQHVCLCYCLWFPEGRPGWLFTVVGMCGPVCVFVGAEER